MGEIIALGLVRAGWDTGDITLVARREERAREATFRTGIETVMDPAAAVAGRRIVLVSVKPKDVSHLLDQVAAVLRKQVHARHEVAGHTDSQGKPAYNLWLSQRRADTVRKYLISHGVDAGNLKARGYGGVQPIADNSTWAGLVSNRRVELRGIH